MHDVIFFIIKINYILKKGTTLRDFIVVILSIDLFEHMAKYSAFLFCLYLLFNLIFGTLL